MFPAAFHLTPSLKAILFRHCCSCQPRHGFKAGLPWDGLEGEVQAGRGRLWPSSTCQPHGSCILSNWEALASSNPPVLQDLPPQSAYGFPGKGDGTGLPMGTHSRNVTCPTVLSPGDWLQIAPRLLFLQTLFVPLAQSPALQQGMESPLRQGPVTSWSCASLFYICLPKFHVLLLCSVL